MAKDSLRIVSMNGGWDTTPGTGICLTLQPFDYVSLVVFFLFVLGIAGLPNGRYTSRGTY
jgi:hypothetical protein